jgi:plasmid stabilization system protein ParE
VSRRLVLRPEAQDEIIEAAEWYNARGRGLAAEFLRALDACIASVLPDPFQYPVVHGEKRRVLLRRFPYALIYTAAVDEVVILACMHGRRDPKRWQSRR